MIKVLFYIFGGAALLFLVGATVLILGVVFSDLKAIRIGKNMLESTDPSLAELDKAEILKSIAENKVEIGFCIMILVDGFVSFAVGFLLSYLF